MPADPVRDAAIDVLLRVFEHGAYLDIALDKKLRRGNFSDRGRRFLTALVYGTVRHRMLCDHVLQPVLRQPLNELPRAIHVILRMGVVQALFLRHVPFHAMVHTSVDLAKKRGHPGTARLTNAVLKRVPKSLDEVALPDPGEDLEGYLRLRYSLPAWIVRMWVRQFGPERAGALCEASSDEASTVLRTNTLKLPAASLVKRLEKGGCVSKLYPPVPEAIQYLDGPPPQRLKLFKSGHFIIQDGASMLPPHLLEPQGAETILDMCAAPGGKASHLAALCDDASAIVVTDNHWRKLRRVWDNATRLGIEGIHLVAADGTAPPFEAAFDRVLVDAPCSGLGTLRRHPDLKYRITREGLDDLSALQTRLLRSAVRLCKNGGLIVYSVCTFTHEETDAVADALVFEGGVQPEDGPEWLNPWKTDTGRYRVLPEKGGLDGYFLMRLRKQS